MGLAAARIRLAGEVVGARVEDSGLAAGCRVRRGGAPDLTVVLAAAARRSPARSASVRAAGARAAAARTAAVRTAVADPAVVPPSPPAGFEGIGVSLSTALDPFGFGEALSRGDASSVVGSLPSEDSAPGPGVRCCAAELPGVSEPGRRNPRPAAAGTATPAATTSADRAAAPRLGRGRGGHDRVGLLPGRRPEARRPRDPAGSPPWAHAGRSARPAAPPWVRRPARSPRPRTAAAPHYPHPDAPAVRTRLRAWREPTSSTLRESGLPLLERSRELGEGWRSRRRGPHRGDTRSP